MLGLEQEIAQTLTATRSGDRQAADRLLPLVYDQLRELAAQRLAHEPPGLTLQATALVHEAYLRVAGDAEEGWDSRGHFFAAAAEAMRRILIERARHRSRLKHGGGRRRLGLDDQQPEVAAHTTPELAEDRLLALDEALAAFEQSDSLRASVVKLRYFAGLTIEQTAASLGLSPATVSRHWDYARAWLSNWIRSHQRD